MPGPQKTPVPKAGAAFFAPAYSFFGKLMKPRFSLALLLAAFIFAAGCSGSSQIRHNSAEEAFQTGFELYEDGNYERAIRYFRAVFSYGRSNEWAPDAQLYLARSYRDDGQHALAATEYDRFIQLYGNDERVPQAEFERALSFYERSPSYQLDQTYTRRALNAFTLFIDRYPNHELVPEAEERIEELQEKLARKQYEAAELYERRQMWEAAANYYESVFDQYPQTEWADDALLGAIRTYIEYADRSIQARQPERYQQAIENYQLLAQTFPESPLLKRAESLYERAQSRLEEVGSGQSLAGDGEQENQLQ